MKSPALELLRCMLLDAARNEPGNRGLDRDYVTIKTRTEHEGLSFLTKTLPLLGDALDRGLADGRFTCPTNFRSQGALPRLFSGLLRDVFGMHTGLLHEKPSLSAVKTLREILRFMKKATSKSDDELLHRQAVRSFLETDASCLVELPDRESHHISGVARLVLATLGQFDPREVWPKHGPGAVSEGLTPSQKWGEVWWAVNSGYLNEYGFDVYLNSSDAPYGPLRPKPKRRSLAPSGVAKILSVPKNTTSRRTITAEPCLNQFIQQGLNGVLRDSISRCAILKQCLSLTDQSKNQVLALEGSKTGLWATIDLSSASDLLGTTLVDLVFAKHALFLKHMHGCRSREATDGKTTVALRKFAGMGNALTFPVQSVCFAVIAIAAILDDMGRRPTWGNVKRTARLVRVYGDDIIVPAAQAAKVVSWIESVGLRVNNRKSFWTGRFRESCGLDAFMGVDVTPVYLRIDPKFNSIGPDELSSLVSASNQLWLRGNYETALRIQQAVEVAVGRPLPLVRADSGSLGWETRKGLSCIGRWNRSLHRFEYRGARVVSRTMRDALCDYPALLATLGSHRGPRDSREDVGCKGGEVYRSPSLQRRMEYLYPLSGRDLQRAPIRYKTRIVWSWMPT